MGEEDGCRLRLPACNEQKDCQEAGGIGEGRLPEDGRRDQKAGEEGSPGCFPCVQCQQG